MYLVQNSKSSISESIMSIIRIIVVKKNCTKIKTDVITIESSIYYLLYSSNFFTNYNFCSLFGGIH